MLDFLYNQTSDSASGEICPRSSDRGSNSPQLQFLTPLADLFALQSAGYQEPGPPSLSNSSRAAFFSDASELTRNSGSRKFVNNSNPSSQLNVCTLSPGLSAALATCWYRVVIRAEPGQAGQYFLKRSKSSQLSKMRSHFRPEFAAN